MESNSDSRRANPSVLKAITIIWEQLRCHERDFACRNPNWVLGLANVTSPNFNENSSRRCSGPPRPSRRFERGCSQKQNMLSDCLRLQPEACSHIYIRFPMAAELSSCVRRPMFSSRHVYKGNAICYEAFHVRNTSVCVSRHRFANGNTVLCTRGLLPKAGFAFF